VDIKGGLTLPIDRDEFGAANSLEKVDLQEKKNGARVQPAASGFAEALGLDRLSWRQSP
jgi:hypothetical protein